MKGFFDLFINRRQEGGFKVAVRKLKNSPYTVRLQLLNATSVKNNYAMADGTAILRSTLDDTWAAHGAITFPRLRSPTLAQCRTTNLAWQTISQEIHSLSGYEKALQKKGYFFSLPMIVFPFFSLYLYV